MDDRKAEDALGVIVYDMCLLASAILIHRSKGLPNSAGLKRVNFQRCASEVMLLKSRALLDLMYPFGRDGERKKTRKDDITMEDLELDPLDDLNPLMRAFQDFANKRSAHLTWDRAERDLETWQDRHSESMVDRSIAVLELAYVTTVEPLLRQGRRPSLVRHVERNDLGLLHQQMRALGLAYLKADAVASLKSHCHRRRTRASEQSDGDGT